VIQFNISKNTIDYINITRTLSTEVETPLANIQHDGTVEVVESVAGLSYVYDSGLSVLTVKLLAMSCSDEGKYKATVVSNDDSHTATADITFKGIL